MSTEAAPTGAKRTLLSVDGLEVSFHGRRALHRAVNGLTYHIDENECFAIVGESGSGKSVAHRAILGILERSGRVTKGSAMFGGKDLLTLRGRELNAIRGNEISMVFQDALSALNPVLTIGFQLTEVLRVRQGLTRSAARAAAVALLDRVEIASAQARMRSYPFEFSGGMRQRVMIALAIATSPRVLLADEPTTALDVTVQAQIMNLLNSIRKEYGMAVVLISHDIALVSEIADRIGVMYAGRIVETGPCEEVIARPAHPYTRALLNSVPRLTGHDRLLPIPGTPPRSDDIPASCEFAPRCTFASDLCGERRPEMARISGVASDRYASCWHSDAVMESRHGTTGCVTQMTDQRDVGSVAGQVEKKIPAIDPASPLLSVRHLVKTFRGSGRGAPQIRAVDDVSFDLYAGQTLGIIGESGSGKSTLARLVIGLENADSGHVFFKGVDMTTLSHSRRRRVRRFMQMVFQDPSEALDPRMSVYQIVTEPWQINSGIVARRDFRERAGELLTKVGLAPDVLNRVPSQFSGGQRQRIGIARAIALNPEIIICDEAVSALDVSIRAQIIALLEELQASLGLSYLFVAHDLSVVRYIADSVAVMWRGKIVEAGPTEHVFENPTHPYTQTLLAASPRLPSDREEGAMARFAQG
jgi:peptide/nickel transport system ATP-binding protein